MASRVVTRHYDRTLAPLGITTPSYSILSRTSREGPLALGELAARLAMDRTTLSRELAPLVAAGLLRAAPAADDRRKRIVELTDAGAELVEQARPLWAKAQAELADEFGAGRAETLMSELHALVGAA
jgi:DNA-binding MarR family transcriptional regulator